MVVESSCGLLSTTTSPATTTAPNTCRPVALGVSEFRLKFVSYENLGDLQSDCSRCDSNTMPGQQNYCDLVLDVCISPLGKRYTSISVVSCCHLGFQYISLAMHCLALRNLHLCRFTDVFFFNTTRIFVRKYSYLAR